MSSRTGNYLLWGLAALGALLLVALILYVISSLPPRRFSILVGREGGAYYQAAQRYQEIAAAHGFALDLIPTAGSLDTLMRLDTGEAGIGFVQSGVARGLGLEGEMQTMAGVFYEPLWIFYRRSLSPDTPLDDLRQLQAMRVSIGERGSGTQVIARELLAETLDDLDALQIEELSTGAAIEALDAGEIDAAFFVAAPSAPDIARLLVDDDLALMNLSLAEAYAKRHDFLEVLPLPRGSLDPNQIIPVADTRLLSPVANLVIRADFHPDLLRLMTIAIVESHAEGGLLEERGEFPSLAYADLPISPREVAYIASLKGGESWLDNYLPFWAAALVDRYLLFLLPAALLLLPMFGRFPIVINIVTRLRINRWYRQVRSIEMGVDNMNAEQLLGAQNRLDALDDQLVKGVDVGPMYVHQLYDLRGHIRDLEEKLNRRAASLQVETPKGDETTNEEKEGIPDRT